MHKTRKGKFKKGGKMYEKVKKLCKKNGISIRQLEMRLGLANGTIRRWDTFNPTLENVIKIAAFFGMTLDELIYGERKVEPQESEATD